MGKITLDRETFKALASDTRLDILRALDGKKMNLKDISSATKLNKATLHEHLTKLHEAGLIRRKGREGHKWVYYKLSWKGECLLHPENTKIVVLFTATFVSLFFGIIQLMNYAKGKIVGFATTFADETQVFAAEERGIEFLGGQSDTFQNVANVANQNTSWTPEFLTKVLNENATSQGIWAHSLAPSDIQWTVDSGLNGMVDEGIRTATRTLSDNAGEVGDTIAGASSNVPTLVAFIQDPMLLNIALICFIVFIILIMIAIWRLWENKTPKL